MMKDVRTELCFALSRKLMRPPAKRTVDYGAYDQWREESLSGSWASFSDEHIVGKDVLDFGCGDGQLALFLAKKQPRRIVGIDLNRSAIERARASMSKAAVPRDTAVEFFVGSVDGLPLADRSFDTLVAFDCLEHVMSPAAILREWHRVLRPGGRCLLEWYPYKGPWGPHMESLIPLPWAHVVFGQRAMFRAAQRLYDLPEFVPRHWDLDDNGNKKPNKWQAWSSFREQGYINELDVPTLRSLAKDCGFEITRLDQRSFGGSFARRAIGKFLMSMPVVGEYFVSYTIVELTRSR